MSDSIMLSGEAVQRAINAYERLENVTTSLVNLVNLNPAIHVEALRESLPEILNDLRFLSEEH